MRQREDGGGQGAEHGREGEHGGVEGGLGGYGEEGGVGRARREREGDCRHGGAQKESPRVCERQINLLNPTLVGPDYAPLYRRKTVSSPGVLFVPCFSSSFTAMIW